MKRLLYGLAISLLVAQVSWGASPRTMSYQGYLADVSGKRVSDGAYPLTFRLYDAMTDGSVEWTETQSVTVVGGIFNVILGRNTPLDIAFDKQYWLGISIGGGAELTPRMKLTASPYSLGGDFWRLTGNAGTGPSANFLGTSDETPLELWVNGARALRLEPHSKSPNVIGGFSGNNALSAEYVYGATIGGGGESGSVNSVADRFATVSGGSGNTASGACSTVSGGLESAASKAYTTVGGGYSNTANGNYATIGGGHTNTASGGASTVAGGYYNTVSDDYATASGGFNNVVSGEYATVSGGYNNIASGGAAAVPGGYGNKAMGNYSFAAGRNAKADEIGSFVFADSTNVGPAIFNAAWPGNDFSVLCTGGARFVASWNPNTGAATGVRLSSGATAWSPMSDRTIKANFTQVDGRDTLERLISIPIETWNYKAQASSIRHIGPMAQDFYAAFGLGEDDKHISTVDADGVALASIQGLYEVVKEKEAVISDQAVRIERLEKKLARLEALVSQWIGIGEGQEIMALVPERMTSSVLTVKK